jgi:hypothetical protein
VGTGMLHNKELHDLYRLLIIMIMKSRETGYMALIEKRNPYRIFVGYPLWKWPLTRSRRRWMANGL